MNPQPKISVIVPIYNAEKYLRQCLDSIVGQTLHDIEIILINDGSKDDSLNIIKEYAKNDKRIVVIDKANEGYGKTMNRGLLTATGEYIGIVESDDWIDLDMYETLYRLARKHDVEMVKCRFIPFDSATEKNKKPSNLPEDDCDRVINPKRNPKVFYSAPSIWTAIYRADFLLENNISFLESPGASYQDTGFNFKVLASARRIWLTMQPLLHYRTEHEEQSTKSKEKVFCVCDEFREIERWMKEYHPEWIKSFEKVYYRVMNESYSWNLNRLDGENRVKFLEQYRKDFSDALRRGVMDFSYMNIKKTAQFKLRMNPSIYNKIKYLAVSKILRIFIKDKVDNEYRRYLLFFCIPIW